MLRKRPDDAQGRRADKMGKIQSDFQDLRMSLGSAEAVSGNLVLLVVARTVGEEDEDGESIEIIRIISARKADRGERRRYENEAR